ncbi:MAG: PAS domain-containing protein, partial [Spirochaetota bacterium]|nr:PAS domain-containing protein [Spirochaetota bacterium]
MSNEIPKVKDPHFKESFNHFIEQCKQKIDFDRFSITLKHQKQLIIFALLTSEEKTELDCNDSYSLENSSSEKCLSTKKPLKNNILIDNYPENEIFKLSNLKSAILFPLVIHKTPVGTLDIMSFEEDNYSDTDINNIEDLVYTLTLILENYNLQTIIRKSESILTHHPDNLEYLIGNTPDPETPINLDDYIWNLLNSLTDFVIIENASGKIIQVSNKILDLLKYSLDEMKNHEIVYFCTEEDKTKLERLKNLSTEQIINLKTKDNTSIPLNIKSIPINNFDGTYNLTVYKVSEQITSLYDPFSQLEEQFSIIDKDYHIQSVSSEIKDQYGDDLISKKCYLAYNKSSEICANCPIKDNKLSTEILKNHFVFTEFKDGKKVMILFSLIKQKDDSISILETYKDEPFKKSFEEQIEIKPIAEEGESVPDEINQFVDYALNKIKSPASTLDTFI